MKEVNPLAIEKRVSTTMATIPAKPNVFLIDDDASVRRAVTRLIKSAGHHVQAFASAREFLDHSPDLDDPACLVLDVRMPGLSGLELQQALQRDQASRPIIFITGHGDIPMSVRAMKAGAVDFLQKPVKDKILLQAIGQALDRAVSERAKRREMEQIRPRLDALTLREREVMELVITGMLNKQIAFKLGTVEKTIKVHRSRVMDKMGANSVAELVRLCEKAGIPPNQ